MAHDAHYSLWLNREGYKIDVITEDWIVTEGDVQRDLLAQGSGSAIVANNSSFHGVHNHFHRDTPSLSSTSNPHANPAPTTIDTQHSFLGTQKEQNLLLDDDIDIIPQHHHPLPEEMEDEEDLEMVRAVLRSQLHNQDGASLAVGIGSNKACSVSELASWESVGMEKELVNSFSFFSRFRSMLASHTGDRCCPPPVDSSTSSSNAPSHRLCKSKSTSVLASRNTSHHHATLRKDMYGHPMGFEEIIPEDAESVHSSLSRENTVNSTHSTMDGLHRGSTVQSFNSTSSSLYQSPYPSHQIQFQYNPMQRRGSLPHITEAINSQQSSSSDNPFANPSKSNQFVIPERPKNYRKKSVQNLDVLSRAEIDAAANGSKDPLDAVRLIMYLHVLLNKYKEKAVEFGPLYNCLVSVHKQMKLDGWLPESQMSSLLNAFDQLQSYFILQLTHYKTYFPQAEPLGVIESTILMLRMIYKNRLYREANPKSTQGSFREMLMGLMTVASVAKYQQIQEECFDAAGLIEGLLKLADVLSEEIEVDAKYFQAAFAREFDIVRITAESYMKYFILTLESNRDIIASNEAVEENSKTVFQLYKKLLAMDRRYGKLVPSLQRLSNSAGFNVEHWFLPFVNNWLDNLCSKTLKWVLSAVKEDSFTSYLQTYDEGDTDAQLNRHSSSITDLFRAVYEEFHFLAKLQWSNEVQNAGFLQRFAKMVNLCIEQYCDAISQGEMTQSQIKKQVNGWEAIRSSLAAVSKANNEQSPTDINTESCVKLCNLEYAILKLNELQQLLNAEKMSKMLHEYRATLKRPLNAHRKELGSDDSFVFGQMKIEIVFAENLKSCNKNGTANPYVVVKVPDGTLAAFLDEEIMGSGFHHPHRSESERPSSLSSSISGGSSVAILTGKDCELARSRIEYDCVNVSIDESFHCILPPVGQLEVIVYSKNTLAADEIIGTARVNLAGSAVSKFHLQDHQTHELFVELEPQGRVLIRLTLDGEDEDIDFWFKKSIQRLNRTRDDIYRALTAKIVPYAKDVLVKSLKESEAVPIPSKSLLSSLTDPIYYSNQTSSGISVDIPLNADEADMALAPLAEHLNRNLSILCLALPPELAQQVVKRTWDETLIVVEYMLVPPLYGHIERERRVLNRRQLSLMDWSLLILKQFFHAEGQDLGLPYSLLQSNKYMEIENLVSHYHGDISRLKREYEMSVLSQNTREKDYILKLIRLRAERMGLDVTPTDFIPRSDSQLLQKHVQELRQWIDVQLVNRRDNRQ